MTASNSSLVKSSLTDGRPRRLVLGISGGIAAYKAVELVRKFRDSGYDVFVVMTAHAAQFITPLTLQVISGNPVRTSLFSPDEESHISHVELAQSYDRIVVAPASANIIAKTACGICDDLLSTVLCAASVPVIIAPAMNTRMWQNPATQKNIDTLIGRGYTIIPPESGFLACNTVGPGRLADTETIFQTVSSSFEDERLLTEKHILITAGPTIEAMDAFRFISNYSTGKMGYALAEKALKMGAEVTLISGPVSLTPPPVKTYIQIKSAQEMYERTIQHAQTADIVIMSAAVSDYRPASYTTGKIKKTADTLTVTLEKNPDILKTLGERKRKGQVLIGFAAETENLQAYARRKLEEKNADMIVGNLIGLSDSGFASDNNHVFLISRSAKIQEHKGTKADIAGIILKQIAGLTAGN